jgi:SSS family solute:Na+ symporter
VFTFHLSPAGIITLHYIHFMVVTLVTSVAAALAFNRFVLGGRAVFAPLSALRGIAA